MRPRAPLSFLSAVAAGTMVVAIGALMGACAKQGEAERCSSKDDCSGDLECVNRPGVNSTICCPPGDGASTDECKGVLVAPTDASSSDTREAAAPTDTLPPNEGGLGSSCTFDSQCVEPFRCRVGKCQYECAGDRDCKLQFSDRQFCDACGDHQCHATFKPEFVGTKDPDSGLCVPPDAGSDGGTDTATSETEPDTSVEDTSVVDTAVEDTATPADTADGGG